jgi:hypothetical protein
LNQFVNGEVELTAAQVQAAKVIIGKVVPDLKAVEVTGPDGGALQTKVMVEFARDAGKAP